MNLSAESKLFLSRSMCIDIHELQDLLVSGYGDSAIVFDALFKFMINDPASHVLKGLNGIPYSIEAGEFRSRCFGFLNSHGYYDCALFDFAYVMIGYFTSFYSGGLVELFKYRQAEDGGPKIYLNKRICSDENISKLPLNIEAYRGMSLAEYDSGTLGMSWSLDIEKAKGFAFDVYNDLPRGVVLKAIIRREAVLYYDPSDTEKEITVANGTIQNGIVVSR